MRSVVGTGDESYKCEQQSVGKSLKRKKTV